MLWSFIIRHVDVQRDIGGNDCSIFEIVFASLCVKPRTTYTAIWEMSNETVLVWMLDNSLLSLVQKTMTIEIPTFKRLPWNKNDSVQGFLIQCHSYKEWYQQKCCFIKMPQWTHESLNIFSVGVNLFEQTVSYIYNY